MSKYYQKKYSVKYGVPVVSKKSHGGGGGEKYDTHDASLWIKEVEG